MPACAKYLVQMHQSAAAAAAGAVAGKTPVGVLCHPAVATVHAWHASTFCYCCLDMTEAAGRPSGQKNQHCVLTHVNMLCSCIFCSQVLLRAGAYLDLASNDGAQLLAASDSAYDLSGLHVTVKFARCNLPPHTIVRGPGYLQGVMVLEQVWTLVLAG